MAVSQLLQQVWEGFDGRLMPSQEEEVRVAH